MKVLREMTNEDWKRFFAIAAGIAIEQGYMEWILSEMIDYTTFDDEDDEAEEIERKMVWEQMKEKFKEILGVEMWEVA
jgi:hypothetical protein